MKVKDLKYLLPKQFKAPMIYYYKKYTNSLEKEIIHLKEIVAPGKRAIDIGANVGIYSFILSRYCKTVEAFEPQPNCAQDIISFKNFFKKNITVHNVGLSNKEGELDLYIPLNNGKLDSGLASFNKQCNECETKTITVPVHTLDSYNFNDIAFIKIDVEGYELEVLEGGRETILREKPFLLIEIEQRHLKDKSFETIFNYIIELGYEGSFIKDNKFVPISEFSYEKDQKPYLNNLRDDRVSFNLYVNNFIFKPIK